MRWLAITFLLALSLRMVVVAASYRAVAANVDHYSQFGAEMGWTARSIASGLGFSSPYIRLTGPTALMPPIYPYLLAGIFRVLGIYTAPAAFMALGLNALFSSLTCIPIFFFTRNALDTRLARIASLAWAVYPFSIYFGASRVWDYALTSLLFSCCLLAAQKLHLRGSLAWAGFGLLYGVAALCNPSIVSLLPLFLLIAICKVRRIEGPWVRNGLLATVGFLVVCMPWVVNREHTLHARFFMRDGFWGEFYAGNNGDTFKSNTEWAHPASNPVEMNEYAAKGEIGYMAAKKTLAMAWVRGHPFEFAWLCVRRAAAFWLGIWSLTPKYLAAEPMDYGNIPFCLFLTWAMLRGIGRWWREDAASVLPFVFTLMIFPLPYYLSHSSPDYRQPIEPVILMLVCVGLFGARSPYAAESESELETAVLTA